MFIVTIWSKNIIKIFEHMKINDFEVGDFDLNFYTVELLRFLKKFGLIKNVYSFSQNTFTTTGYVE